MKLKGIFDRRKIITQNYWIDMHIWWNVIPSLYLEFRLAFKQGHGMFNQGYHRLVIGFLMLHVTMHFCYRLKKNEPITEWI